MPVPLQNRQQARNGQPSAPTILHKVPKLFANHFSCKHTCILTSSAVICKFKISSSQLLLRGQRPEVFQFFQPAPSGLGVSLQDIWIGFPL
jgi:hypothetical protein